MVDSAQNPDEIVVGQNGEIYVAPEGTALPATESAALNAAFGELGFATEDGVKLNRNQTINDIKVWQSRYPARRIVEDEVLTAGFAMKQWNKRTTELALGARVTVVSAGHFKLAPLPIENSIDVRVLCVDWHDGDKDYRLLVPRCIVTENGEINIVRKDAADLPVTLSVLAEEGGGDPWFILSNDPALAS